MKTSSKLKRIGLRTIDRGGSNLVLGLFHYHPEFFSLSEKITFDTKDYDSLPVHVDVDQGGLERFLEALQLTRARPSNDRQLLKWLQTEGCSMFGKSDYDRKIDEARNIVIKIPRETAYYEKEGQFEYKYCNHEYDKTCYLIRNPFRVAISYLNHFYFGGFGRRPHTPHDVLHNHLDSIFEDNSGLVKEVSQSVIKWTEKRLQEYKKDMELGIDSELIFLEPFVKNFENELPKLVKWADDSADPIIDRDLGKRYFNSIIKPYRDTLDVSGFQAPRFHGGFQPCLEINLERLMHEDIKSFFIDCEIIDYAKEKLGYQAFDYWHNDKEHNYIHELNLDLI